MRCADLASILQSGVASGWSKNHYSVAVPKPVFNNEAATSPKEMAPFWRGHLHSAINTHDDFA